MPASPPSNTEALPKSAPSRMRRLLPVIVLAVIALLLWIFRGRIHFDWRTLLHELRSVAIEPVLIAVGCIYVGYWLRAVRWAVLLSPVRKSTSLELFPAQVIGFTIVGLFGRVADLARPYLIARRLHTPVATQLAVYSIERAFDLGAAAILFSVTLAFAPSSMPHHEAFARAGLLSFAATLFLAIFAVALRFAGELLARLAARLLHPFSARLSESVAAKLLDFRQGLEAISTLRELLYALALSLMMWIGIAFAYIECAHAFPASPQLATLSLAATMLLMATSMGGSLFQLPVLGWFTQIAVLAAALHTLFGVPLETASACGAIILFVMNLSIIPAGLIAARIQGITLTEAARNAEAPSS
jgi:uncharacterized membrane protein YbhN (UPF0104 family)